MNASQRALVALPAVLVLGALLVYDLAAGSAPGDWNAWLEDFSTVEEDIHGGTAGVADEDFYRRVRNFLRAVKAPGGPAAAVDLHHGLAAWDYAEAARAGDLLIAQLASMDFGNDQIKKVVGKIDNNRLRRIVAVHNKITRQNAKQKKHG